MSRVPSRYKLFSAWRCDCGCDCPFVVTSEDTICMLEHERWMPYNWEGVFEDSYPHPDSDSIWARYCAAQLRGEIAEWSK